MDRRPETVQTEIDRALDTLGIPRFDRAGTILTQDDRLDLWVKDPRAGRFTARSVGVEAEPAPHSA